jgi:uncharacterized protein (TIGR01777 family)
VKRILVSGSSGFVGTALCQHLAACGYQVLRLVRRPAQSESEIFWDPAAGSIDSSKLNHLHSVVHLAGENIASGRWTTARKKIIQDSRVKSTALLAHALATASAPPESFVSASAVGIYGNRGTLECGEDTAPGQGFLSETAIAWEAAAVTAQKAGIRVVTPRIGIVLAWNGGALQRMKLPFSLGLGGRLGAGTQFMSWISLHDLVRLIQFCIENREVAGPVNAVSPQPVTNADFTQTLAAHLKRPALFPAPACVLRLLLGQFADEALLSSTRAIPLKLHSLGFQFNDQTLTSAFGRQQK